MTLRTIAAIVIGLMAAQPTLILERAALAGTISGNRVTEVEDSALPTEVDAARPIRIQITMALRGREQLEALIAEQQDPASLLFHHWLTPDQFEDRFGPTADDKAMVERWLTAGGFSLEPGNPSRSMIVADAQASVLESVLGTKIHTTPDGSIYANLAEPSVPPAIAPLIASIDGLSNSARAASTYADSIRAVANPDAMINGKLAFGPHDLWEFYDETELNAAGVTGAGIDCIALVERSDFDTASVDVFTTTFGLPAANVTRVYPDGVSPGPVPEDLREILLDIRA